MSKSWDRSSASFSDGDTDGDANGDADGISDSESINFIRSMNDWLRTDIRPVKIERKT